MRLSIAILTAALFSLAFPFETLAQKADKPAAAKKAEKKATPKKGSENTLAACQDGIDNDGDGHVDCDDQDCEIFAVCIKPPAPEPQPAPAPMPAQVVEPARAPVAPAPPPVPEVHHLCFDGVDNDGDGATDCADEGCRFERGCRARVEAGRNCLDGIDNDGNGLVDCADPGCASVRRCHPGPETGRACLDGIDNDGNGLIDCADPGCLEERYCVKKRLYVPTPPNKAPGLLIDLGVGLAVPNWRRSGAYVPANENRYNERIPFRPDLGFAMDMQVGYLPLRWLGFGVAGFLTETSGTNETDWYDLRENDPFKYEGSATHWNVSGFVRFQWPSEIFVPYFNIAAGYSYNSYRWAVYPEWENWYDIADHDTYATDERSTYHAVYKHFTLAVEPGFDVFVRRRSVAIGVRAWLPVWANQDAGSDNLGVMLSLSFFPMYRERPQVRPEYDVRPLSWEDDAKPSPYGEKDEKALEMAGEGGSGEAPVAATGGSIESVAPAPPAPESPPPAMAPAPPPAPPPAPENPYENPYTSPPSPK
ncbi:MAG: hypothetical protein PHU25_13555 [Deltaproteobacteria bacterium]|nr:hypothetical protein [Deltaproteobacteria bacterium]